MIKMLAIDLDGTMYTSKRTISPQVKQSIARAAENGLQPVIVTGRGRIGAEIALDLLGMDFPYICSAGALLRPGKQGPALHTWPFHEHAELLRVIGFIRHHKAGLIADPPEGIPYWFGPDSMQEIMDPLTSAEARHSQRTENPETDFDRPLLKATITATGDTLVEAEKFVRAECPSLHPVISGIQYIDLTGDGVNKGTALGVLAEIRGLQAAEIAAIGDQKIDLHMLEYAGLPIAMQNGVPDLKQVARWVAPSNDEDGVAWAIDEILKLNGYN